MSPIEKLYEWFSASPVRLALIMMALAALLLFASHANAAFPVYQPSQGGTGSSSPSGILKGNGTAPIRTAVPGTDYQAPLSLPLSITNGGTATGTQVTNGVNYFDGTKITSGTGLTYTGTNFGIGTTTPQTTLAVAGGSVINANFSGYSPLTGNSTNAGSISIGSNPAFQGILQYTAASNTTLSLDNTYDSASAVTQFRMRTRGTPVTAMTILGSGNVGVGTTSPYAPLSVNGQVVALNFTATSTSAASTFPYASTTAISATAICLTGDICRTTWPSGGGASFSYLFPSNATTTGLGLYASTTIGNGTANGGLTTNGGATTTGQAYFAGKVGIGTTTPGSVLSIQGVANFVASAVSTIFNDLRILGSLYLPSLGTPSGSFLAVDPSGKIIATTTPSGTSDGYLLMSTTTSVAYPTLQATTTTACPHLKVTFDTTGFAIADIPDIYFNNDRSANYGSEIHWVVGKTWSLDNGDNGSLGSLIPVSTTSPSHYTFDIYNPVSARKMVSWSGGAFPLSAARPVDGGGAIGWNNTAAAITNIAFTSNTGKNYNAGSSFNAYCYSE